MSNIEIALMGVSLVIASVGVFSAIWFPIEKRQAEQRKKSLQTAFPDWPIAGESVPSTYFRPHVRELVATEHER